MTRAVCLAYNMHKWLRFGAKMLCADLDDFQPGETVITPSGRRAVVKKLLAGTSKRDCFSRLTCRYEGGGPRDLVTLQPHQVRKLPPEPMVIIPGSAADPRQLDLFAVKYS